MTSAIHQASAERKRKMQSATEQMLEQTIQRTLQLNRTVWQLATLQGGEVIIDDNSISPFWRLDFSRLDDGKLCIKASLSPEPTEDEVQKLVSDMAGTNLDIREAITKAKMDWLPVTYIMGRLRTHIIYDQTTNKWRKISTQPAPPCNTTE